MVTNITHSIQFCSLLVVSFLLTTSLIAQEYTLNQNPTRNNSSTTINGYGAMNYYYFNWDTDSLKRNAIDNERFIIELRHQWLNKIALNAEIEFEHGGTGAELEFDRFEEFGEFEFDITKGGEVLLEQLNLEFSFKENLKVNVGRIKVPFGLMFKKDEPTDYLTAINSEMESQILPENWTENGIGVSGILGKRNNLKYHVSLVNGLDGSAFNSANWIKRGNQKRFEMVNAENFALCLRLDNQVNKNLQYGFSIYGSRSTSDNRPKPDLKLSTPLLIYEAHFSYDKQPFYLSSMVLHGYLGNSEALTNQNRNLSNNLNVKRTAVGSSAFAVFGEFGITIFNKKNKWIKESSSLVAYGRYDYYDTMFKTQGMVFNNPRWERQSAMIGVVYKLIPEVQFKSQYTLRKVGAPPTSNINGGTLEQTFIAGFAFEF